MAFIISTDIGTTHCKVIAVDPKGQTAASLKAPVRSNQPFEGSHEQDPEAIFNTVIGLWQRIVSTVNETEISAFTFSAAMHSILMMDKQGNAISAAMTWADTRSKKYAQQLRSTPLGKKIYGLTGTPIHAMSPLCKIMYLRHEQPRLFGEAVKFISIKEYIFYRLFGKYVVDIGIASATGLYDIFDNHWSPEALELAGIDESKLSVVVPAFHSETGLSQDFRDKLSISGDMPFITGGNDGCLANLGCGALGESEAALTIGTSGAVRIATQKPLQPITDGLFRYMLTDDIFITGGPINNGGITLKWFAENLLDLKIEKNEDLDNVLGMAEKAPAGSGGLIFVPFLLGERAPVWNEDAFGVFYGLKFHHRKEHLARAVVEGIGYSLVMILENIEKNEHAIKNLYLSGIVIQSDWWSQLLADMTGKQVTVNDSTDASAMGAAFIAMNAIGWIDRLQSVKSFFHDRRIFLPDIGKYQTYEKQLSLFKSLVHLQTDEARMVPA